MGQIKDAKNSLEEILDGKEYRIYYDESRNIFEVWWDRAKEWLANLLENLFPSIQSGSGAAGIVLFFVVLVIVLLLGISTFLLVRYSRRNKRFRKQTPLHSAEELSWTYHKHLHEAKIQEESQQYSFAARHYFLALLLYFHENEWLEAKLWKTNWEYYEELRKINQSWANEFYDLALLFDKVAYGEYEISKEEFIQFKEKAMVWFNNIERSKEVKHAES
ncbi:DUF4129 domain-containing protein [Ferdinandcohnia sp. Marseille-Q9671]